MQLQPPSQLQSPSPLQLQSPSPLQSQSPSPLWQLPLPWQHSCSCGGEVLAVQALGQLLVGGAAHALHLAGEMQGLAGHRMVEIHLDRALGNLADRALDHLPGLVQHRDGAADHEQVLADLAVDGERRLGKVDQERRIIFAIAVFGAQDEIESVVRLLVLQRRFELGKKHTAAMDVFKGCAGSGLVRNLAFNFECVAHGHDFVFLYFHSAKLMVFFYLYAIR